MLTSKLKSVKYLSLITIGLIALSGCAVVAAPVVTAISPKVGNEKLAKRTAFAIGLDENQFTISDATKSGQRTEYKVSANNGSQYRCYIVSTILAPTTDAVCTKSGEQVCNDLLKAAGKC